MRVLDPGHQYALDHLDGDDVEILTFVKREGFSYPGNRGHYEGTNMQEVVRALIDRLKYVDYQVPSHHNEISIHLLRGVLLQLELRAATRHRRDLVLKLRDRIEHEAVCEQCKHICCEGSCRA